MHSVTDSSSESSESEEETDSEEEESSEEEDSEEEDSEEESENEQEDKKETDKSKVEKGSGSADGIQDPIVGLLPHSPSLLFRLCSLTVVISQSLVSVFGMIQSFDVMTIVYFAVDHCLPYYVVL